ncbi:MAG: hypothetical protein HFI93_05715 [Lachnospiraceae bacterium]|nr:hypothetical protein [Lachnospiraceae bacterium]
MAYSGWLIKVGNYIIPAGKFIKAESYSAYVNMQDLDPWTDADGYIHREAVELKAEKVEFETPAMLTNVLFTELMRNIQANYTVPRARQLILTAYIPEYDDYVTQTAYLADFTPQIYSSAGGIIRYNPVRLSFIGGVYHGGS